jgi:hypothetical protein
MARIWPFLQAKSAVPTARIASGMAAASRWGFRKNPLGFGEDHDETSKTSRKSPMFFLFFLVDPPNLREDSSTI